MIAAIAAMQAAIDRYYKAEIAARYIDTPENHLKLENRRQTIILIAQRIAKNGLTPK